MHMFLYTELQYSSDCITECIIIKSDNPCDTKQQIHNCLFFYSMLQLKKYYISLCFVSGSSLTNFHYTNYRESTERPKRWFIGENTVTNATYSCVLYIQIKHNKEEFHCLTKKFLSRQTKKNRYVSHMLANPCPSLVRARGSTPLLSSLDSIGLRVCLSSGTSLLSFFVCFSLLIEIQCFISI